MYIWSYLHRGFLGQLVKIEVDLRLGIPGITLVGLPDGAVREARERVRVACMSSGYNFPAGRVLVSMAPAGEKKMGAGFDLALALSILVRSGALPDIERDILVMGELELSGALRGVGDVLGAVVAGLDAGIEYFLLPEENVHLARELGRGHIIGISHLSEATQIFERIGSGEPLTEGEAPPSYPETQSDLSPHLLDMADVRGQAQLKRALEIAAAGGHHALIFGPPGCGKTMTAMRFPSLLPELSIEKSIELTRIHRIAGAGDGLMRWPPLRAPHHSASIQGIVGGGEACMPGEISLAHGGVLFLDELGEFSRRIIQALREPMEQGRVDLARAGYHYWYPADFQLVAALNPCPCGNLGREDVACICSVFEIQRYWKRLGSPLLDRFDLRIPVESPMPQELLSPPGESSEQIRARVAEARKIQEARQGKNLLNASLNSGAIYCYAQLTAEAKELLMDAMKQYALSSRALHSIIKVARTIEDLAGGAVEIGEHALAEALQYRRYGEQDFYWKELG